MSIVRIWTDDEEIIVDSEDVGELESAMRFKAEHPDADADPELYAAVANSLSSLWDNAVRAIHEANRIKEMCVRLLKEVEES